MLEDTVIVSGGTELLDGVQNLWEQLNAHHVSLSPHFADVFSRKTFAERKQALLNQGTGGLRVLLARDPAGGLIGYCISTVSADRIGEIDSLFVLPEHRGQGLADGLMRLSLVWLREQNVSRIRLTVAAGNEQVFGFYARHGFFPAKIILEQMPDLSSE